MSLNDDDFTSGWRHPGPSLVREEDSQDRKDGENIYVGSHRFARLESDSLRKRAIRGATLSAPQAQNQDDGLEGYRSAATRPPREYFQKGDQSDEADGDYGILNDQPSRPSIAEHVTGSHHHHYNRATTPSLDSWEAETDAPKFDPGRSSPPAFIGDPSSWLLPRPFRHETCLPLAEETRAHDTNGDSDCQSLVSNMSSNNSSLGLGRSSSASTPSPMRKDIHNSSIIPSPYFGKKRREKVMSAGYPSSLTPTDTSDSSESLDPFSRRLVQLRRRYPSSMTASTTPNRSLDPFVDSNSNLSSRHESGQQVEQPPRSHIKAGRYDIDDYSSLLDDSSSVSHYGPSIHDGNSIISGRDLHSHPLELGRIHRHVPSAVSGAMTQTLTPNTSPYQYRRELIDRQPVLRGNIALFGCEAAHIGDQNARYQESSPQLLPSTNKHHKRTDSSILSPLIYKMNQQYAVKSTEDYDTNVPGFSRNRPEVEDLDMLNLDLDSTSDSDIVSDDEVGGVVHTLPVPRAGSASNSLSTPGTHEAQDSVVCAISESRSSDVIGLATLNVTMGRVDIIRIVNDDRYHRLIETLWRMPTWPQTFLVLKKVIDERSKSSLALRLKQEFPGSEIVPLEREHWNESEGLRMIDRFALPGAIKAVRSDLDRNFYASCAFSAVMSYVEEVSEVIFRENSLQIKYSQAADTMGLDRSTITSLELLQNIRQTKGPSTTLFKLLNNTLTPQGRRLLRSTVLQPSTNQDVIIARHEAVEELSSNEDLFTDVRRSLKKLLHIDIERSIPWIALRVEESRLALQDGLALIQGRHQIIMPSHEELQGAERDLNHILIIKAYLEGIQGLQQTLEAAACTSALCKWALERFKPDNTAPIIALLNSAIEEDAIYSKAPIDIRNNRLWAIKAEPNSVLEQARLLYRERTNEMHEYVQGLNRTFEERMGNAPELRLGNDNHYYLRFQWPDVEREVSRGLTTMGAEKSNRAQHWRQRFIAGVEIVNGVRRKKHYDCQTMELIQKSSQIQHQADIVTAQSDKYVAELKKSLAEFAESLRDLNEATAVLDMLCSFAHLATTQNYVQPLISDNLILKGARHPIVEVRKENFVPNDVYSGDQDARFKVITGGNMSGKSTFIRSIALIQLMGQIGSFVPAQYAAIPICDRLFTRLSTEDKPEGNMGTFAVEMAEINVILRQATKDSLVIIDELGRGTSTKEGLAIALAVSEKLIEKGCRVFFATHFTELARVLNYTKRNSVLNVHVVGETSMNGDIPQIMLPHTIASGPVKNEDYGLDLARRFLPEQVVKNAKQVWRFLCDRNTSRPTGPATKAMKQNKLVLALPDLLKQALNSSMDDSALASYIRKLQTEFTLRMNMATEDDAQHGEKSDSAHRAAVHPVLEKPSDHELREWKKKCDAAERRVMHANTAHSQGRKHSSSGNNITTSHSNKRPRTDGRSDCMSRRPTPINRGSMIEEQRKDASTSTASRENGPSSSSMDLPDPQTESDITMDIEMTAAQTTSPAGILTGALTPGHDQRAESIPSGSCSAHEDALNDGIDAGNDAIQAPEPSDTPSQPLQSFQPLKAWYARTGQGDGESGAGGPEHEHAPTEGRVRAGRSAGQGFVSESDEDGDE